MLERYFSFAGLSHSSKLRLFRGIVHTRKGGRLRASGSLSYTRMRELLLAKLSSLGFNAKSFGVHSLRSGGATAAANAGVPDTLFECHGRWRSESAKDGYVKDSVSSLLSVSRRLGLLLAVSLPVLCDPIVTSLMMVCGVHSRLYCIL